MARVAVWRWLTAPSRKALAAVGATNRLTIANTRGAQLTLNVIAEYRLALTAASALRLEGGA